MIRGECRKIGNEEQVEEQLNHAGFMSNVKRFELLALEAL